MRNTNNAGPVLPPAIEGPGSYKPAAGVPYSNPAGTEYPIIADNGFPKTLDKTEAQIREVLQGIKNCGFNVTIWLCSRLTDEWLNQISTYYKVSASVGLRTIYNYSNKIPIVYPKQENAGTAKPEGFKYDDPSMEEYVRMLNLNSNNKNLWGYKLKDEPKFEIWGYRSLVAPEGKQDLLSAYRTYLQNANGHVAYVTLVADLSDELVGVTINSSDASKKDKYEMYLKAFMDKFNPSMLTVDIYPIIEYTLDKAFVTEFNGYSILNWYYYMLEAIGNFSAQYGIPFWMYMLSNQHQTYQKGNNTINTIFAYPSKGVLRYQAMTALAYGFQGLLFWTYTLMENEYQDPPYTKLLKTKYITAPYVNGHTTEVWDNCKAVIPEIKQYGKVLLGAKFRAARHVYGPEYVREFPETTKLTSPLGCVASATAQGKGFVITHLTKGLENFLAIVSHDPYNSQEIALTVSNDYDWHVIQPGSSVESAGDAPDKPEKGASGTTQLMKYTLGAGSMILISYTD